MIFLKTCKKNFFFIQKIFQSFFDVLNKIEKFWKYFRDSLFLKNKFGSYFLKILTKLNLLLNIWKNIFFLN